MKKYIILLSMILFFIVVPIFVFAFSVEYVEQYNYSAYYNEAGFFSGIWHGLIAPYSLIVRWFSPLNNTFNVDMYACANTGWFYDLGFLLGIFLSIPIGWIAAIIAFMALLI